MIQQNQYSGSLFQQLYRPQNTGRLNQPTQKPYSQTTVPLPSQRMQTVSFEPVDMQARQQPFANPAANVPVAMNKPQNANQVLQDRARAKQDARQARLAARQNINKQWMWDNFGFARGRQWLRPMNSLYPGFYGRSSTPGFNPMPWVSAYENSIADM
jgi:hypothetical protein